MTLGWSPQEDDVVTEMWTEGFSASEIAGMIINRTRNAVIGRVHRLGLSQTTRKTRERETKPRAPRARIRRAAPLRRPLRVLEPIEPPRIVLRPGEVEPNGVPVTLIELCSAGCKWPVDSELPYHFCNKLRRGGSPYCGEHTVKSFAHQNTDNALASRGHLED